MSDQQPAFLYIDDHPASRKVMRMMLEDVLGYENLTLLENSQDLLPWLEALDQTFDVIFLDLHLGPLDGFEICRLLKSDPRFKDSQIIALTASMMPDELNTVREVGFDGLISKPINHQIFGSHIERLLAGESVWEIE